uniref:Not3 domain-containing protein n=1 Tax=Macrostomum lignano TaxID=282301 RepID=A0A1I8G7D0_9PLAT
MAANRKLLADVEKTLKKIGEGQKAFQDIFDKFNESVNQAQKEKFENELKREIKKLQRYREQIKTWQASNEIKDKRNLAEARKNIESDMERFKIIEKETKTKAYSKEGLGAEQKKDPLQKEKEDIMDWVRENISTLEKQIEKLEYDIELLIANSKKKKLDRDKQDEMDSKKDIIGKHRFHIHRLEAIMRMLDNDNLELEKVKDIKDDVEYYVNQNEEADFWENYNENIYDELELEDIGVSLLLLHRPHQPDLHPVHPPPPPPLRPLIRSRLSRSRRGSANSQSSSQGGGSVGGGGLQSLLRLSQAGLTPQHQLLLQQQQQQQQQQQTASSLLSGGDGI